MTEQQSPKQQPSLVDRLRELLKGLGDVLNPPAPAPQPVPVRKSPYNG